MSKLGRKLLPLAVCASLLVPAQALAQGEFIVDLYGGLGIPTGSFSDYVKTGFNGGAGLGYLFTPRVGIRGDFALGSYNAADGSELFEEAPGGFNQTVLRFDAAIMFRLTDPATTKVIFVADAGGGLTSFSFRDTDGVDKTKPDSETSFTIPFGVGIGYMASDNVSLFLRGRAYIAFVKEDVWGHSTFVDFPVWAGVGFTFGGS